MKIHYKVKELSVFRSGTAIECTTYEEFNRISAELLNKGYIGWCILMTPAPIRSSEWTDGEVGYWYCRTVDNCTTVTDFETIKKHMIIPPHILKLTKISSYSVQIESIE